MPCLYNDSQICDSSTNMHFRFAYPTYYHFAIFTLLSDKNLSQFCVLMLFTKFGSFLLLLMLYTGLITIPQASQALSLSLHILFSANVTSSGRSSLAALSFFNLLFYLFFHKLFHHLTLQRIFNYLSVSFCFPH